MSNIIVRVPQPGDKPRPKFIHWLLLNWAALLAMDKKERINAGAFLLVISIPIGIASFAVIDKVVASVQTEIEKPTPRMTMRTPAALTLSVEDGGEPAIWKVPDVARGPVAKKKRDTAPRSLSELAPVDTEAYIKRWKDAAIKSMRATGVPASISLAQGIIESNSGKSFLATNANNHFGIKCSAGNKCRKGHCVNRTDDSHKDFFLKFGSADEAFRFHGKFLSQGRYKTLHKHGKDYRKWAHGLKAVGYATDPAYARTLIATIERYNLNKYD